MTLNSNVKKYIDESEDPWGLKKTGLIEKRAAFMLKAFGGGKKILDVGGGFGIYSNMLQKNGNDVICLDYSSRMTKDGKKMFPEMKFVKADATCMPFVDSVFDAMLCMGTMIYISDKIAFFSEASRIMKSGGKLVLIERNRNDVINKAIRLLKDTETYVDSTDSFLTAKDIRHASGKHFKIKKTKGRLSNFIFCVLEKI